MTRSAPVTRWPTLLQRAAKQSDNTAAYLIKQRLGEQYIQDRTAAWGLTATSVAQDQTTPKDIGNTLRKGRAAASAPRAKCPRCARTPY